MSTPRNVLFLPLTTPRHDALLAERAAYAASLLVFVVGMSRAGAHAQSQGELLLATATVLLLSVLLVVVGLVSGLGARFAQLTEPRPPAGPSPEPCPSSACPRGPA